MADIFNEVEEELRKDKYQEWLRTYGPWFAGAAAILIIGVAGYEGWKAWSTEQEESASATYNAALADVSADRLDEAAAEFEMIADEGPHGYAVLALMQRGALALDQGDRDAAADFFEQAAERASDPIIGDLATMKAIWARFESYSADDLSNRLSPLTAEDRPYRYLAREAIGVSALNAGDYDTARRQFEAITYSLDAPEGVRVRATAAMAVVTRMAPQPEDVAGDATPDDSLAEDAGADVLDMSVSDETVETDAPVADDETAADEAGVDGALEEDN